MPIPIDQTDLRTTDSLCYLGPVPAQGRPRPLPLHPLPLMRWPVQAGFPSPAEDDQEAALDLHQMLVEHPEATFLLRVKGHSMQDAGIEDGDVLVVDRALEASHGRIVIAVVDGEFTVKRLYRRGNRVCLEAANPDYPVIQFRDGQELQVWGVVTRIIKSV